MYILPVVFFFFLCLNLLFPDNFLDSFVLSLALHLLFLFQYFPLQSMFSTPLTSLPSLVVTDVCRPRRLPPWCGRAALWGSWVGIALANSISIFAGLGFNQSVAMMWLISCFASFLGSCLLLEPIKVGHKQTHL